MQNYQLDYIFQRVKILAQNNGHIKSLNDLGILIKKLENIQKEDVSEIDHCFRLKVKMTSFLPENINPYYHIYWNYIKALDIAKNSNISVQNIKLREIYFDPANTVPSKMEDYRNKQQCKDPVIIAHYPPANQLIVIDGNHRCSIAKEKKQETIDAYILSPELHINAFNSDVDLAFYDFHLKYAEVFNELGSTIW